jgi:hypothetical protein
MAFYDYIKFINFKNNTNNVLNKTLNGKTYVTNFGNSYWSFDIKTVPITRTTWHSDFFDFYDTETTAKNTTFLLPVLNDAAGTVSGTVSVLDDSSTAPEYSVSVGETKIPVSGGSGTLLAGDLIKFSNHSKVYMLSEDTNLDGSSIDVINITPPLVAGVGPADGSTLVTITYDNVPITVIADDDIIEFKTDTKGYYAFQQTFREVI